MIASVKHDESVMPRGGDWVPCEPYTWKTSYRGGVLDIGSLSGAWVSTIDKNQFREDGVTKNRILDPAWRNITGREEISSELVRVLLPDGSEEIHLQVVENKTSHERARRISERIYNGRMPPNIVMLVLDTIPRPYLPTYFPKTVAWLKGLNSRSSERWRAFSFNRYNSQPGSTSPSN